jgi:threonylcarbamoyladenosine tRNA methylthiotransferase MtaB
MVGFPGENDASFRKTLSLVEELSPAYLHVFPFSPRPGTPAATFAPKVPPPEAAARAAALRSLSDRFRGRYYAGFIGKALEVVPEDMIADGRRTTIRTRSDNYLTVNVEGTRAPASTGRFWAQLEQVSDGEAYGTPLRTP